MAKAYGKDLSDQRMTDFLRRLLDSDSEGTIDFCLTKIEISSQVRDDILGFYLRDESARTPDAGINALFRLRDKYPGALKEEDFCQAMRIFLETDRRAALLWFDEHKDSISKSTTDFLHGAVSAEFAQNSEFHEAWKRLDQIHDQTVRARFERDIWVTESKIIAKETEKNPAGFIENLAFGKSPHAQFWLKKGFREWYQRSPDEANSWFAENQFRMGPDQSQHIARAYAEVALEGGDIGLAREWSAQVVDPEFKEKLVEQIEARAREVNE